MRDARPLHVGLNLIFLVPGEVGGMEVYARELLPALVAAAPEVRFTAFINREATETGGPWGEVVPSVTVPVRARRRSEWVRGEQQLLPRLAARAGVDLMHSLASTAPARGRFRRVVTVHDLIYLHVPETHFGARSLGMRILVPLAARRSHRVIAISRSTRDDVVQRLGIPAARVDVVHQGVRAPQVVGASVASETRSRLGLEGRSVLLTTSAKRPHKNLARLLDALALIPSAERPVLLLPGYPTPYEAELVSRAQHVGVANDVRFLGWVDETELEGLYAVADGFVFPSLYEGFGLPVLEAFVRGVPVACSDRSSLPEVAGEAAILFDPEDPRSIAGAVTSLLGDAALRARLAAAGLERVALFTWDQTARGTLASYSRALGVGAFEAPEPLSASPRVHSEGVSGISGDDGVERARD